MSGMDIKQASIFHERQEPGSMLCAQHALNNLLQVPLYSASELANIAHELDVLEAAQLDDGEGLADRMQNADDSGFFSVAVIEKALEVVNLRLVRWESADMRPYHSVPEDFSAFVLNFDKHWFVMRRFAQSSEWFFNLNSFLPQPERISKLYLGVQLHQAERDNYSVFVVLPDEEGMAAGRTPQNCLSPCPADDFFASHQHLAFTSFGRPATKKANATASTTSASIPSSAASYASALSPAESSASSSASRPRSLSFDSDNERSASKRARQRKDHPKTETSSLLNGRPSSAMDEEEMLRRAIEASIADAGTQPQASISNGIVSKPAVGSNHSSGKQIKINPVNGKSKQAPLVTEISSDSEDGVSPVGESTSKEVDQHHELSDALKASTIASRGTSQENGSDDSGFEEDAPSMEDLRAKRLARFNR